MPVASFNADLIAYLIGPANANYAAVHDAALADLVGTGNITLENTLDGTPLYYVTRGELSFDTSPLALLGSIVITGGVLSLFIKRPVHASETDLGQATIHVVEGVHGDDPEVADYGLLLPKVVSGGEGPAYADIPPVQGDWFDITLTAAGVSWINNTMTKFGLRVKGDIDNAIPTGFNDVVVDNKSNLPVLTVTYNERRYRGNINIDQLIYQHTERMVR